jgi:hypothetical protein
MVVTPHRIFSFGARLRALSASKNTFGKRTRRDSSVTNSASDSGHPSAEADETMGQSGINPQRVGHRSGRQGRRQIDTVVEQRIEFANANPNRR